MEFVNLNLTTFILFMVISLGFIFLAYMSYKKQLKFNKSFNLLSSNKYFYIKYIFLLISLFIVLFSIFWVRYWEKNVKNEVNWIDMMFVLDVSKSMNVADIGDSNYNYTRLDVIKDSIAKFIASHREDRFGLVIFAGDAISTVPLTTDHDLFLTFLNGVDYRNLTKQWSNFEKALSLWIERFNNSNDRSKSLVFISDWGDAVDNINKSRIKEIYNRVKWITYSIVGVWTSSGWKIIKGRDAFWRYIFQRYKWEYVVSKINRSNLEDIASVLNWNYFEVKNIWDLSNLNSSINSLAKKVISKWVTWELADAWRKLSILSFVSFMIFLILYLFEGSIYFLMRKNEK